MQVQELGDRSVAAAQQLQIATGGDRFQILTAQSLRERVHGLAPAPEIILLPGCPLSPRAQRPLKRVAMRVDQSRQSEAGDDGAGRRCVGGYIGVSPRSLMVTVALRSQ